MLPDPVPFTRADNTPLARVEFEGLRESPAPALTYSFRIEFQPDASAEEVYQVLEAVADAVQIAAGEVQAGYWNEGGDGHGA